MLSEKIVVILQPETITERRRGRRQFYIYE
jgi:hypothetical protein